VIAAARGRILALLFIAYSAAAFGGASVPLVPMKNPIPADAFTVRDVDGKPVSLSDFKGKVVLLNFWATWCPPCAREMPSMEKLYQAYSAKGFAIVGVSVDVGASRSVKEFAQKLKVTFPILHDRDSIVSRHYSVPGVPTSYLIDRRGRIVYRVLGEYDWFGSEAQKAVTGLLQGTY
jgi:peroxiredoxin